jgi:hypothetical protein
MLNPATEEVAKELMKGKGARKPKLPDRPPEEVAREKLLADEKGRLGVPADYLLSCLIQAGRLVPYDKKRMLSTKEESLIPGLISIEEDFLPFEPEGKITDPPGKTWVVDIRIGTPPGQDTTMPIIRPKFPKWSFQATLEFDPALISETTVKQLCEVAGRIGLGAHRRKGRFGRFRLVNWQILKEKKT